MASDAAFSGFDAFFDRLRNDPDLPGIIPFVMGFGVRSPPDSDQAAADPRPRVGRLNVLLVNGDAQNVVIIESGSAGIDSLLRQLAKDGHPPASKASIAAMPTVTVTESGGECPICLNEFEVGGEVKQMPCNHLFHGDCAEKWLTAHGTCPVCRFTMPVAEEEPEKKTENENRVSVSIIIRTSSGNEEDSDQSGDSAPREAVAEADDGGDHLQS